MHPPTIPMGGPHSLNSAEPRRASAATITKVTKAVNIPPTGSSAVVSSNSLNTTDAKVTDRIIMIVPLTMGVTTRRKKNSHRETASCTIAETTTNEVKVAGPPSTTAVMQNGMANAAVNIGRVMPEPIDPTRNVWMIVERPTTMREAKTIQTT